MKLRINSPKTAEFYLERAVECERLADEAMAKENRALLNFEWVNFARRGGRFDPTARG